MARSEPKAAHALVIDLLSIAGINAVGGRSVEEIADRFLEQAALGSQTSLPHEMALLIERFLWITGDPDKVAAELRTLASDANVNMNAALDLFESRTGFLAARGVDVSRIRFSTRFFIGLDYYTGFEFRLHDPSGRIEYAAGRRRPLRQAAEPPRQRRRRSRRSALGVWIERLMRLREAVMSGPFVIAVPAKGRLQEHTDAFFARAGLELVKPRGERDYRGTIKGVPGVEVAYLSASEITLLLAQGAVHFGVTGEDLVREEMPDPDAKVVLLEAARLRRRQCDRGGAAGLDRRATAWPISTTSRPRSASSTTARCGSRPNI